MKAFGNRLDAEYFELFRSDWNYAAEARRLQARHPTAKTVLEIGAGCGQLTEHLLELGLHVTALEPSGPMLWRLFDRVGDHPYLHVRDCTIQEYCADRPQCFDLAVAHYDVLNYVPPAELGRVLEYLNVATEARSIEVWDPDKPVQFLRHRRHRGCRQIRVAYHWFGAVHVWFLYSGLDRSSVSRHVIYLHRLADHGILRGQEARICLARHAN